jgi:DNA-binding XRE family transcriptional regulator
LVPVNYIKVGACKKSCLITALCLHFVMRCYHAGNTLKIIGARMRDLRKEKGLTREQLTEISGFHFTYIGAIERGEKNITMLNLEKMSEALEVEYKNFFAMPTLI